MNHDYHIDPHGHCLRVTWDIDIEWLLNTLATAPATGRRELEREAAALVKSVLVLAVSLETNGEHGIVKFFDPERGWGFITDAKQQDIFVHYRGIAGVPGEYRSLEPGQHVRFKRRQGKASAEAVDVVPEEIARGKQRGV